MGSSAGWSRRVTHEGQGNKLVHINGEGLAPADTLREVDGWIAVESTAWFE